MDLHHKRVRLSQAQFIAFGFFLMILAGTFLLMLPVSSRDRGWTDPLSASFTATSASCVTGLVVFDTFSHWSLFGQLVLLCLIQIGGLGFMVIGVGFSLLFQRRIGLRQRDLLYESVNAFEIGSILQLWRVVVFGTILFEMVGALLLSIRFIPEFGFFQGLYFGIFHSISAFCNAGFDLMGAKGAYSSLTSYVLDPYVNLVLAGLIVIGGLGFVVWQDLRENRFSWKRYKLHTKLVLAVNFALVFGGMLLYFLFEKQSSMASLNSAERLLASFFASVSDRTAGFNTVDLAELSPAGLLLSLFLMFIGGSPGSTAGGIKTTTLAVLLIYIFCSLRGDAGTNAYRRRISDDVIKKAAMVFCINLGLAFFAAVLILATSSLPLGDVLFETFSAVSTVGLTTGITRDLNTIGRLAIALLMFAGRVGGITFALSLIRRNTIEKLRYPEEKITIG